jgi:hypothetical protein
MVIEETCMNAMNMLVSPMVLASIVLMLL